MRYPFYDLLTDPAKKRPELWRLALGIVLVFLIWYGMGAAFVALARPVVGAENYFGFLEEIRFGVTPRGLLILLFLIAPLGIGAMVAAEMMHHRPARSLFGPMRLAIHQFLRALFAVALLYLAIYILPPWGLGAELQPGLPLQQWLGLLPLTLLALLIQTGSEEVFFRGYLQSQLAARGLPPALWIGLPSVAFGLAHYSPAAYGENAILVAIWAFFFGVLTADLTARCGTLGPAIALHFASNFLAIGIVGLEGQLSGLALYQLPFQSDDIAQMRAVLPFDLAQLVLCWLAVRVAMRV